MNWSKAKPKNTQAERILPPGYFTEIEPLSIYIQQGPFSGIRFIVKDKVKIVPDALTNVPQLCYDYQITDYAGFNSVEIESSIPLSRIIAAIAIDLLAEEIDDGAVIETNN